MRAPNWGYVYDRTVHDLAKTLSLAPYAEPKIEPEIIVGLCAVPSPGMDDAALLSCIGWVAHGFEIVQSVSRTGNSPRPTALPPTRCTARC